MSVTREVILDLLPLYLSGEASTQTTQLVRDYLANDPELADVARREQEAMLAVMSPGTPSPDLEVRSLLRTRRRLAVQRWAFGLAWFFTAITCSVRLDIEQGRVVRLQFLLLEMPVMFVTAAALAVTSWALYFNARRSSRVVP